MLIEGIKQVTNLAIAAVSAPATNLPVAQLASVADIAARAATRISPIAQNAVNSLPQITSSNSIV